MCNHLLWVPWRSTCRPIDERLYGLLDACMDRWTAVQRLKVPARVTDIRSSTHSAVITAMEHGHEVMRDYPAPEIQTRGSRLRILVHCWARFRTATPRWIRAALYMVLVGGAWLVVVPLTLVHLGPPAPLPQVRTLGIAAAGLGLFLLGTVLALWAGYDLMVQGQGTPFPLDPTTDIVTRGAYRYVRNPQAIAMTLMVAGEVVALRAPRLWLTLPLLVVFLEGLARPWEDRQLLETYGACYVRYRERVPRWLPRRPSR